ncbi:MAG: hypothetical protein H0T77_02480 [Pyrinomonadaceae bacterium]|nr:hypothetical protein [Pyrinomonadaceae bacterium]
MPKHLMEVEVGEVGIGTTALTYSPRSGLKFPDPFGRRFGRDAAKQPS